MEKMDKARFDGLMGSTRTPWTRITANERGWYSEDNEKVLCVVVEDTTDHDFVCIVLARDRVGRYRAVDLSKFFPTMAEAEQALPALLREWADKGSKEYEQGDEPRRQMDFFTPRHPRERLNQDFLRLIEEEELSPAKGIIESMMYYFEDPDGNFVEQFQSTAFNSRIWELYLFAVLAENRCWIDRTHPAPDYLFTDVVGEGFIEAVTVNPSGAAADPPFPKEQRELETFTRQFLPIKFAGPLTAKLARKYWEQPYIGTRPVMLAVADFHQPGASALSQPALMDYVYGQSFERQYDALGRLTLRSTPIAEHVWGTKHVPSGFFSLPDAQNISAVISFSENLLEKFNRMGFRAGFGSKRIRMTVGGKKISEHPSRQAPQLFTSAVSSRDYQECWTDGLQIYHNPNAVRPLDIRIFGDATHHRLFHGSFEGIYVEGSPFDLQTTVQIVADPPTGS